MTPDIILSAGVIAGAGFIFGAGRIVQSIQNGRWVNVKTCDAFRQGEAKTLQAFKEAQDVVARTHVETLKLLSTELSYIRTRVDEIAAHKKA
jgi:hypothetical protein